ncbi:MAG: hypothetical protein JSR47_05195 [Proteobacteria bacterium]|nr:hypothetical protein [Pseudomonadota bacterium]
MHFVHHRIEAAPRKWAAVAQRLSKAELKGGTLYGAWRSQIGRPRDEIQAMTLWPTETAAKAAEQALLGGASDVRHVVSQSLAPTLRPTDATPPTRQGNYAFRWFATPEPHWPEFLDLCAGAWPGFEAAYDSQVVGLWRATGDGTGAGRDEASGAGLQAGVRSLLLTRRPNLAMWERSKLPSGAAEAAVRDKLSRRYDLCDWTVVSTSTLLTATDTQDTARWT